MTNFRVERIFLTALIVAALCAAEPALGQTASEGPVLLRPPGAGELPPPGSAPRRLVPNAKSEQTSPTTSDPAQDVSPAQPQHLKSGIEAEGLTAIDTESVGALTLRDGGLGFDLWQGLSRTDAVDLVRTIPAGLFSPALRDLAARMLLSRAKAPLAVDETASSLLVARAEALIRIGDVEGVELLMSVAPTQDRPKGLDKIDAILQMLKYDNARACGLARNNTEQAGDDFWQRLLVYCDALDGRAENVAFGISLLREVAGDDPAMVLLSDAILTGNQVTLETISDPKPIHLALSRAAKAQLPPNVAESDDPLVLYGAALAVNLPLGGRIEAAERGVTLGALSPAELRGLYVQVKFAETDLANALTRADEIGGPAARALLYQAAVKQNIAVARAEIITSALDVAREDDRYRAAALAFRPLIDRLQPSPEMVWFALTGVRAYLTLGDRNGAERWLALLRASSDVLEESRLALSRVRPLVRMLGAGDGDAPMSTLFAMWLPTLEGRPELAHARTLVNGMFLALGETLPNQAWQGVPHESSAPQPMPPAAVWIKFRESLRQFKSASQGTQRPNAAAPQSRPRDLVGLNGVSGAAQLPAAPSARTGVAKPLIHTLETFGSGTTGIAVIYEVVGALRDLGFEQTARKLAVETLLAAGL